MKTLQIDETRARKLYPGAASDLKEILHDTFGKEFFNQKITDRVNSFETACQELGINQFSLMPSISHPDLQKETESIHAYIKLTIIIRALNEGWTPNWNNSNEPKYLPWFDVEASSKQPSGSGLSYGGYAGWYSAAHVGSRLCYKSEEIAKYAGTKFKKLYEQYFLLP